MIAANKAADKDLQGAINPRSLQTAAEKAARVEKCSSLEKADKRSYKGCRVQEQQNATL